MNGSREPLSLTHEERSRMRREIISYMEMKPLRTSQTSPSRSWTFNSFLSMRPVAAMLILAVFVSSAGVSYAAEGALPGDILYPVKTRLNEPVSGALAVSASAKAAWAMDVAGERLEEAATLAAQGKLDDSAKQELRDNFEAHADIALTTIGEQASTSPESGTESAIRFEAELSEYGRVFAEVAAATNADATDLSSSINSKRQRVAALRGEAESQAIARAATSSKGGELAASRMRDAAKQQLSDSFKLARSASRALESSSAHDVDEQLENTKTLISDGESQIDTDSPQALGTFQKALSTTRKLGVFLKTSSAIHKRTGFVIGQPGSSGSAYSKQGGSGSGQQSEKTYSARAAASTSGGQEMSLMSAMSIEMATSAAPAQATDVPAPQYVSDEQESGDDHQDSGRRGRGKDDAPVLQLSVPLPSFP